MCNPISRLTVSGGQAGQVVRISENLARTKTEKAEKGAEKRKNLEIVGQIVLCGRAFWDRGAFLLGHCAELGRGHAGELLER